LPITGSLSLRDSSVTERNNLAADCVAAQIARAARLHIPVFRNLFLGSKKPFLTGFLRIFFSSVFRRNFYRNVFLEGSQEFRFFSNFTGFFAGIPVGRNSCIYSGFRRIPVPAESCLAQASD
jgi:hypothetical protein